MTGLSASVALCTYNGAAFLEQQLATIAQQTRLPMDLVVGDDGSSDATIAIVERFTRQAPFAVRLVRHPAHMGYRANFMATAAACAGDIVFFSDQDDIWCDTKIARMMQCFADHPDVLLAYHDAMLVDAQGQGTGRLFDAAAQRALLAQTPLAPWHYTLGFTQAFRRELLAYQPLWPASRDHMSDAVMAHDQWFIFLAAALGRVAFVEEPLVLHRQHGANTYGVRAVSRWQRLRSRFSHDAEWDRLAALAAERRAQVLEGIASGPAASARLTAIAAGYRRLAVRHARRHAGYTAPALTTRAASFAQAVLGGDYRGRPWGLEPKAVVRDAVLGVLRAGGKASA